MDQKRSWIIIILCLVITLSGGIISARAEDEAAAAPTAPAAEYPQGELISRYVGFYWSPAENADRYEVNWEDSWGGKGSDELEGSDPSCESGRCTAFAELPAEGSYTWTVTAVNDAGSAASEALSFSVLPVLSAPDSYRPNTALGIGKPLTFEWEDTMENVTEFRIQATESETDRIRLDQWYTAAGIYAGNGVRVLNSDLYLPTGSYRWRVQAKNDTSVSGWSRWTDFSVTCPECELGTYSNTTSAALFPFGMTADPAPVFEWFSVTGASNYVLTISDPAGTEVFSGSIPASDCTYLSCSYQPEISYTKGEIYRWTVSTHGWNNVFWGSGEGNFMITDPGTAPAGSLSFLFPKDGEILTPDNAEIIWSDPGSPNGTFRLAVLDPSGATLLYSDLTRDDAWCDGYSCSIRFQSIPGGEDYRIILAEYSDLNIPGTPVSLTFSIK